MKKYNRILLLVLCAALLAGATIAGTVAYLTSQATVTNTFTVGNVSITMVETKVNEYGEVPEGDTETTTKNTYKLIPGHTYTKDPTITVGADSEDCYIFVKIDNGLGEDATIKMESDWEQVDGQTNVWMYETSKKANESVTAFEEFTFAADADPEKYVTKDNDGKVTDSEKIIVTAYAIQATDLGGADTADEIWDLFNVD